MAALLLEDVTLEFEPSQVELSAGQTVTNADVIRLLEQHGVPLVELEGSS
jgi:plastocyanin